MEEVGFIAQTLQSIEIGDDACAFAETDAEGIFFSSWHLAANNSWSGPQPIS